MIRLFTTRLFMICLFMIRLYVVEDNRDVLRPVSAPTHARARTLRWRCRKSQFMLFAFCFLLFAFRFYTSDAFHWSLEPSCGVQKPHESFRYQDHARLDMVQGNTFQALHAFSRYSFVSSCAAKYRNNLLHVQIE